jgi:hypothetical protein
MKWARHVARMEEKRGAYRVLIRNPEGRGQLRRLRRICENNIKIDLPEVESGMGGH